MRAFFQKPVIINLYIAAVSLDMNYIIALAHNRLKRSNKIIKWKYHILWICCERHLNYIRFINLCFNSQIIIIKIFFFHVSKALNNWAANRTASNLQCLNDINSHHSHIIINNPGIHKTGLISIIIIICIHFVCRAVHRRSSLFVRWQIISNKQKENSRLLFGNRDQQRNNNE